jgi:hypothetical protein
MHGFLTLVLTLGCAWFICPALCWSWCRERDSTWRRRWNPVCESCCILNANRTTVDFQKHNNFFINVPSSQPFGSYFHKAMVIYPLQKYVLLLNKDLHITGVLMRIAMNTSGSHFSDIATAPLKSKPDTDSWNAGREGRAGTVCITNRGMKCKTMWRQISKLSAKCTAQRLS